MTPVYPAQTLDSSKSVRRRRSNNRLAPLLDAAAGLFATKGFKATTTRDIAEAVSMQSGSVYYHFASKGELLLAVYDAGVATLRRSVEEAVALHSNPLERVRAALRAHLEALLAPSAYARVIGSVRPDDVAGFETRLIDIRDAYEAIFTRLLSKLEFHGDADPAIVRMLVIGAANHTRDWYRPDGRDPAYIADQLVGLLAGRLCRTVRQDRAGE